MKKNKIGIIGAGTMGNGIAHVFALFDFKVILVDINESVLDIAKTTIINNMNRQLKKGVINNNQFKNSINNILFSKDIKNLDDCDLVIEAIKEDFDIKCKVFKELDLI